LPDATCRSLISVCTRLQGGGAGIEHHDLTALYPLRVQLRQMGFHLVGFADPGETNRPSIIFFDLSNHYAEFFIFP